MAAVRHFSTSRHLFALQAIGQAINGFGVHGRGQTFVHKVYGYRGIILNSWNARIYEKPVKSKGALNLCRRENYYQVLRDIRDDPEQLRSLDIPSYVSAKDVLPYKPEVALVNPHIDAYFHVSPDLVYNPSEKLSNSFYIYESMLAYSGIYRNCMNGVTVTTIPMFDHVHSDPASNRFMWQYYICIENTTNKEPIELLSREWTISDDRGATSNITGNGVVGRFPILSLSERFEYISTSGVLSTPIGSMTGFYNFELDKRPFKVSIPLFWLQSPYADNVPE